MDAIQKAIALFPSKKALADELDVSAPTITYWSSGKKRPSLENVLKIEKITDGYVKAEEIYPNFLWSALRKTYDKKTD
jgi:DNA-binding transcriptional regulator YdaS (Cro superfamily)